MYMSWCIVCVQVQMYVGLLSLKFISTCTFFLCLTWWQVNWWYKCKPILTYMYLCIYMYMYMYIHIYVYMYVHRCSGIIYGTCTCTYIVFACPCIYVIYMYMNNHLYRTPQYTEERNRKRKKERRHTCTCTCTCTHKHTKPKLQTLRNKYIILTGSMYTMYMYMYILYDGKALVKLSQFVRNTLTVEPSLTL